MLSGLELSVLGTVAIPLSSIVRKLNVVDYICLSCINKS